MEERKPTKSLLGKIFCMRSYRYFEKLCCSNCGDEFELGAAGAVTEADLKEQKDDWLCPYCESVDDQERWRRRGKNKAEKSKENKGLLTWFLRF